MPKAFISYAREDKAFVDEYIRLTLATLNIETWIDTDNLHGAELWKEMIERAMHDCDYFLLVVTTAAAASPSVRGEVEWILAKKPELLVPVLAERVRLDGVHPKLPDIQHVDCVDKKPGRVAALIARTLFHLNDRRAVRSTRNCNRYRRRTFNSRKRFETRPTNCATLTSSFIRSSISTATGAVRPSAKSLRSFRGRNAMRRSFPS